MKLTFRSLTCHGQPRSGYTIFCEDANLNPGTLEVMALEFLTGDIPWDKKFPVRVREL